MVHISKAKTSAFPSRLLRVFTPETVVNQHFPVRSILVTFSSTVSGISKGKFDSTLRLGVCDTASGLGSLPSRRTGNPNKNWEHTFVTHGVSFNDSFFVFLMQAFHGSRRRTGHFEGFGRVSLLPRWLFLNLKAI